MALPTLDKTWQFDVNNQLTSLANAQHDNAQVLISIKDALKGFASNPWVVIASSDSVVADGNDNWSDPTTDVIWGLPGNPHSWIQLRQTGIDTNFEIIIEAGDPGSSYRDITLAMSPKIGFTGGSTTARPTASDEVILLNDARYFDSAFTFDARMHYMQSTDGQCTRIIGYASTLTGGPRLIWIFDKLKDPVSGWTTPAIGSADSSTISGRYALLHDDDQYTHGYQNGPFDVYLTCESYGSGVGTLGTLLTGPNNINGTYPIMGMGAHSETPGNRGRHGTLHDLWWGLQSVSDLETYGGEFRTFVQFSDLIFPWNGTVPIGY
jgi:hypothetical protein